jgi:hypothetical protein
VNLRLTSFLLCATFTAGVLAPSLQVRAADATGPEAKSAAAAKRLADGPPLDEVIVNGKRDTLGKLRTEMEKAEDAIYSGFNELNTVPEYDTSCHEETDSQTRMRKRICTPKFVDTAQAYYAQERIQGRENIDPATLINAKMPAYRKHFLDVVLGDPKLSKASSDYFALYQHYERLKKERAKE